MTKIQQVCRDRVDTDSSAISETTVIYIRRKLLAWGRSHHASFPWRADSNRFHTLVAEIMLQRTRAEQVLPVYLTFIARYPDPSSLARASIREIEAAIMPLGLKWRARKLIQLGKSLEEKDMQIPTSEDSLRTLPGVGAYVASAYLSLYAGKRAVIVDSNIVRFYGRFFGFDTGPETRRSNNVKELADRITSERRFKEFNCALIDFTRNICKPRPEHEVCPVKAKCCLWTRELIQGARYVR